MTRKYFHLTTAAVYTYGVAVDPDFLCLSSYVAVCTLILVEVFEVAMYDHLLLAKLPFVINSYLITITCDNMLVDDTKEEIDVNR